MVCKMSNLRERGFRWGGGESGEEGGGKKIKLI